MKRTGILRTAELMVTGNREEDYGTPEDNFNKIANLWNAAFGTKFGAPDVALAMILVKVARQSTGNGSEDTWVDIAGYAACGGEIDSNEAWGLPNQECKEAGCFFKYPMSDIPVGSMSHNDNFSEGE